MLTFLVHFNIISLLLNVPRNKEKTKKIVFTSFHCFFQYIFLSTFLAVFISQCLVANGRIPSSRRQERNIEGNDSAMVPPGKLSALSTIPAVKDKKKKYSPHKKNTFCSAGRDSEKALKGSIEKFKSLEKSFFFLHYFYLSVLGHSLYQNSGRKSQLLDSYYFDALLASMHTISSSFILCGKKKTGGRLISC